MSSKSPKARESILSPPPSADAAVVRAQKAKHSVNILLGGGALSPPSHNPFVFVRARMCVRVLFVCDCVSQVSAKKAERLSRGDPAHS